MQYVFLSLFTIGGTNRETSPHRRRNRLCGKKSNEDIMIFYEYAWKLEQKDGFRLVGKRITVSCENNLHFKKIPEFWNETKKKESITYGVEGSIEGNFYCRASDGTAKYSLRSDQATAAGKTKIEEWFTAVQSPDTEDFTETEAAG